MESWKVISLESSTREGVNIRCRGVFFRCRRREGRVSDRGNIVRLSADTYASYNLCGFIGWFVFVCSLGIRSVHPASSRSRFVKLFKSIDFFLLYRIPFISSSLVILWKFFLLSVWMVWNTFGRDWCICIIVKSNTMGPVLIRHRSQEIATQPWHSVDRAGWQVEMASIEFWFPWRVRMAPVEIIALPVMQWENEWRAGGVLEEHVNRDILFVFASGLPAAWNGLLQSFCIVLFV